MKKIVLFISLIISYSLFSQVNTQKLDSFFNILQQKNKAMGSVAITKNGKLLYSKAIGFIDSAKTISSNTSTKYRIGSISKMFTASIIFQLIEEKKLTLETKLSAFFKEIPNAEKISIEQMLHHSSGIYNITEDSLYLDWCTKPITQNEMVKKISSYKSDVEPDSKVEYSNSNYILLGYIIEKITKKSYKQILADRIINKIELKNTLYGNKINNKNNEANSFLFASNEYKNFDYETDMSVPNAAGAIVSTPTDLNIFIEHLFSYKIVSKESVDKMMNIKYGMGLGMFSFPFNGKTAFGHNGGIDGFNSIVGYFPKDSVAVCYISNGINYKTNDILIGVLSIYFNQNFTIPTFEINTVDVDLSKLIGTYSTSTFPLKIDITTNGKVLMAQATGQSSFELEYKGNNTFTFNAAGIELVFNIATNEMTLKQMGRSFVLKKEN